VKKVKKWIKEIPDRKASISAMEKLDEILKLP